MQLLKNLKKKINRVRDERYIIKDNILTNRLFFLPTKTKEKYTQSIFKKIKYKIKKIMAKILMLAKSGFGKSTSLGNIPELEIEGLDPKETFIISCVNKPLPFKKSK